MIYGFQTVNRFLKIKKTFTIKLKMIFIDHHFLLHQVSKIKYKKYFPKSILGPTKRSITKRSINVAMEPSSSLLSLSLNSFFYFTDSEVFITDVRPIVTLKVLGLLACPMQYACVHVPLILSCT
jgi:hypothetical protein